MDNKTVIKHFKDGKGQFYTKVQISDNISIEPETGYMFCRNAILGNVGVQKYLGKEIGLTDSEAEKVIEIRREPEDVFDSNSLASYEGKPITLLHPQEKVKSTNFKKYIVGAITDKNIRQDNDNVVTDLVFYDAYTIDKVQKKEFKDLSLGYQARIVQLADGTFKQTEIIINHLALVEEGRAVNAQLVDNQTVSETEETPLVPKDFSDTVHVTTTHKEYDIIETYDDETGESTFNEIEKHQSKTSRYETVKQQLYDTKTQEQNKNKEGDLEMEKNFKYFMDELKSLLTFPKSDFRDQAYKALADECKETLNVDLPTLDTIKINVVAGSIGLKDSKDELEHEDDKTPKALSVYAKDEDMFFDELYRKMDNPEVARKYASMTFRDVYSAIREGRAL